MDFPAKRSNSGLGSNDSRWLTPPRMKSQITLFAFGGKCGKPFGGDHGSSARAMPSRASIAPSARPVKPIPMSARNVRRERGRQPGQDADISADGDEIIVVEQGVNQVGARALRRVRLLLRFQRGAQFD